MECRTKRLCPVCRPPWQEVGMPHHCAAKLHHCVRCAPERPHLVRVRARVRGRVRGRDRVRVRVRVRVSV